MSLLTEPAKLGCQGIYPGEDSMDRPAEAGQVYWMFLEGQLVMADLGPKGFQCPLANINFKKRKLDT